MKIFIFGLALIFGSAGTLSAQGFPSTENPPEMIQMVRLNSTEPSYCDPSDFLTHEVKIPHEIEQGLRLPHVFKFGQITLAGFAVGKSKAESIQDLAHHYAKGELDSGFNTWYLHHKNEEIKKMVNWAPLYKNPTNSNEEQAYFEFRLALKSQFFNSDNNPRNNFLSSLEKSKYLAIGCQGMHHRGPSAFAMILAFSGCTPTHSVEIVDRLWGLNGVKYEVRASIAEAGFDLGEIYGEERKKFQKLFSPAVN
ncbi:MAG: hypothetical protein ABIQ95_04450 [Bdellovibrionia bacterium]